jgi:hypothetical protein
MLSAAAPSYEGSAMQVLRKARADYGKGVISQTVANRIRVPQLVARERFRVSTVNQGLTLMFNDWLQVRPLKRLARLFAKFIRKQMIKFHMMLAYMKTYPDEWWYHERDIARRALHMENSSRGPQNMTNLEWRTSYLNVVRRD